MKKKYRCLFDTFIVNVVLLFSSIIYIKNYVDKMSSDFYNFHRSSNYQCCEHIDNLSIKLGIINIFLVNVRVKD